ncbi:MAG TPA: heterodisulfide reductase-related iron-sulfur binding cluster, partial [Methanofastidiosum sp.]|nr:heterodisulfide reductase-related iron-sulfur binding cluster [Methanofastidiosum sp.]
SRCCGAGGGVKSLFGELAIAMARERFKDAIEVEAEAIISTCPFCKRNLKDVSEIDVSDLSEILLKYSE